MRYAEDGGTKAHTQHSGQKSKGERGGERRTTCSRASDGSVLLQAVEEREEGQRQGREKRAPAWVIPASLIHSLLEGDFAEPL